MSTAASRAKVPLIAGGAALAGLAGGLAVLSRRRGPAGRNEAIDFDRMISAAQRLGSFGEELGRVATAIRRVTETSRLD